MRFLLAVLAIALIGGCDDMQMPEGVSEGENGEVRQPTISSGLRIHGSPEAPYGSMSDGGRAVEGEAGLDETPTPTPTPSPLVPDVPEPTAPAEAEGDSEPPGIAEDVPVASGGRPRLEHTPLPPPEGLALPAGTLVSGVTLTIYSCLGDSTGSYCPGGQAMYSGQQVHRGAIACGWQWDIGQRLRIVGDPYVDMVYTCLDRGGAVTGIDVWFYDYHDPETQAWRAALPRTVTVELLD